MILYSISSDIRTKTLFAIAALAIGSTLGLSHLFRLLPLGIAAPSAFAVFGLYVWLFDRFLWCWPVIRKTHGIPYLAGQWGGVVRRAEADDPDAEIPVQAVVQQTWSRIQFEVIGKQSRSVIRSLSMDVAPLTRKSVLYIYEMRPLAEAAGASMRGDGCQELVLVDDDTLEGPYFSSKLRKGVLRLTRQVGA